MSTIPIGWYLFISATLFGLGLISIISRRNLIYVLIGVELILNACNLNFVAFARGADAVIDGRMFAIFVIIMAVAEAAVALAIILNIFGLFDSIRPDDPDLLKE